MKTMKSLIATAAIAAGLSFVAAPGTAQAQNAIVDAARVLVNVSDIVYRNGQPYYRYGDYGPQDRIIVVSEGGRDRYYRQAPRGVAHGYYGTQPGHNKRMTTKQYQKYQKDQRKRWEKQRKADRKRWEKARRY